MKRRAHPGFVLLEVLVSLVILAVGSTAILHSLRQSLSAAEKAAIINRGTMLAENLIEEVQVAPPDTGSYSGDFGEDNPGYTYEMEIKNEKIHYTGKDRRNGAEDFRPLKRVSLDVFRAEGTGARKKPFRVIHLDSAILGIQKFTSDAINEYQLFDLY